MNNNNNRITEEQIEAEWERLKANVKKGWNRALEEHADMFGCSTREAQANIITSWIIANRLWRAKRAKSIPRLIYWGVAGITFHNRMQQARTRTVTEKGLAALQVRS